MAVRVRLLFAMLASLGAIVCGATLIISSAAAERSHRASGHGRGIVATAAGVQSATHAVLAADRVRALRARDLKVCLDRHRHCAGVRRAWQRAGVRLGLAKRRLARVSHGSGQAAAGVISPGSFHFGVVGGPAHLWELSFISGLRAHSARMEFDISTPASEMEPVIDAYAKAGIRPLLLASFNGDLPTVAQARNLASWAAEFGPGGSFWRGKSYPPSTAVTDIEFGNETSYSYQFSNNSNGAYADRAHTYALRARDASVAIRAANPAVGLLAIGDPSGIGTEWVDNMFKAVPDLGQLVAGWTVHPYGPDWQSRMDTVISSTQAAGAPDALPLYVTEWGLSTDNGRCLDDNYGWGRCMSYAQAAGTLTATITAMRARYGSRVAALYLFGARDELPAGRSSGREGYFGALQSNLSPKGAYTNAVQALLAGNP
jgi:hypothetical protein